ncbi:MAG: hypothetical protein HY049_00250 [Acidobacteria bacterium]|nr:hypothetical protein [Acidobacteriota bacterium]
MIQTVPPIRNRHLVRELDRGRLKELLLLVALVGTLLLPLLAYVWNHMEYIRVGYDMERLKKDRAAQVQLRERLRIEKSNLESLTRVEREAADTLHLVPSSGARIDLTEEAPKSVAMSGPVRARGTADEVVR